MIKGSISRDGNTLTWHVASYTSPDGKAVLSETVQRRVGPARKGEHLHSGSWRRIGVTVDSKSDWVLKLDGNRYGWRFRVRRHRGRAGQARRRPCADYLPRRDLIVETYLPAKGTVDDILSMQLMPDGGTIRPTGVYGPEKRSTTFNLYTQGE